jgi:hypothetical protein
MMPDAANPSEIVRDGLVIQADTSSINDEVSDQIVGVELPPILRDTALNVTDTEVIRRILDDPNYPTRAGQPMETVDASVLLHKLP